MGNTCHEYWRADDTWNQVDLKREPETRAPLKPTSLSPTDDHLKDPPTKDQESILQACSRAKCSEPKTDYTVQTGVIKARVPKLLDPHSSSISLRRSREGSPVVHKKRLTKQ